MLAVALGMGSGGLTTMVVHFDIGGALSRNGYRECLIGVRYVAFE